MRKSITGTIAALSAVALLTGCGSSGKSSSVTRPAPGASALGKGETTITFWHALGGPNGKALQSLIDQFNAAHRGKIKVKAVYQGTYPDLLAKYSAAVRSKSTPSMLTMYDVGTGFMADAKQTVAAQDLAAANPGTLSLDDLQPSARSYYTVNGKLLSVPFNTSTPLLYVNKDILAKAGASTSTLSTLDDIAAAATKVHAAGDGPGFTEPYDGWWAEQLTSASGTTLCTPDNGRKGSAVTGVQLTGDAQVKALQTVANLYSSGAALDTGTDGSQALTAFTAGKVAMMFNSSGAATQIRTSATFKWEALPYPVTGDSTNSGPIIGGASMWVSSTGHSSAEQAASWQLISFLDSAASQATFGAATGYVPINVKAPDQASYKTVLAQRPESQTALTQLIKTPASTATAGCLSGALPTVRGDVISALQSAFSGTTSLPDALKSAQGKADTDIKNYLQQVGK